jgi:hypothetical protein
MILLKSKNDKSNLDNTTQPFEDLEYDRIKQEKVKIA